jgi:hypothetical protein
VCGERLQVGLDSSASAGIGTSDGQRLWNGMFGVERGHRLLPKNKKRRWRLPSTTSIVAVPSPE